MFVMTPNPIFKFLTRLIRNHLHAEMHEAKTNPSVSPLLDEFHAASLFQHHFVTCPSIHVKNNRVRTCKDTFILWPAIQYHFDVQTRKIIQALC